VPNTSATGGPLAPAASPAPLEGQALNEFFSTWIAGIIGLDGQWIRPSFQAEPPNIPVAGQAWVAFRRVNRTSDPFPAIVHRDSGNGGLGLDELQRHERIELLLSFYDLGTNGLADTYASLFRDGTAIAQNREPLTLAQMGLVACGDLIEVPSLLKQRWNYRVDVAVTIARAITRTYPVENLVSAEITVTTDQGVTVAITP
jgi:hypothetical protein